MLLEPLPQVLVIDPDPGFLDSLRGDVRSDMAPIATVSTAEEAWAALSDRGRRFSAIFLNPALSRPRGLGLIHAAQLHRPVTPVYLILDAGEELAAGEDLSRLPVHGALAKPLDYAAILSRVAPVPCFFDPPGDCALETDAGAAAPLEADARYAPIRAEDFFAGGRSLFDVHLKLAEGRFVKILHQGDAFSQDRVIELLRKGVRHLYLRREAQESYLRRCEQLADELLSDPGAPPEAKVTATLNQGEETLSYLKAAGLGGEALGHALLFAESSRKLALQLAREASGRAKTLLEHCATYDHSSGTAMIASLVLLQLGSRSDRMLRLTGLAAILHDLGMHEVLPGLEEEDPADLRPEQLVLYRTHPAAGARLLAGLRGVDPLVLQAIEQHHERRHRTGFPGRTAPHQLSRLAEVIGISDEFSVLIRRSAIKPGLDPLLEMTTSYLEGFSPPVQKAFLAAFGQS